MDIKCSDISNYMEELAPSCLAEDWDNVGLLLGSGNKAVRKILVCLDVTANVVREAVQKQADLIVSHHPLIFKGMKKIVEDDPKGRIIIELIKNGIGVYSAHTNLDVADNGVNEYLAKVLGLTGLQNLNHYKSEDLFKIVVFVPEDHTDSVRAAMCGAGAGWVGNYSDCTFMTRGTGTFKPLEGTNPYIGVKGEIERVEEYRLETIVPKSKAGSVVSAMLKAHPYEEVAYDMYPLKLKGKEYGLGKVGKLDGAVSVEEFIEKVKTNLEIDALRLIGKPRGLIEKVAVFCGSFDDNISSALRHRADVLVTGDIKYHTAQDAVEAGICIIDAGHFATERIMIPALAEIIKRKFSEVEVFTSEVEENPIKTC